MNKVTRLLRRYRILIGYLVVAGVFGPALLMFLDHIPDFELWLADQGYTMRSPEWLALTALVPVLWFVRIHTLTDFPWLQSLVSATLRSLMIVAIAVGLTQITHTSTEARTVATVFVVDVSESVTEPILADAQLALQDAWDHRGDGAVRLVTFAESAQVVPLAVTQGTGKLEAIPVPKQGRLGSNLEAGLRLAFGQFPPGQLKRLVIVSDGNETDGNALTQVETAARLGIRVFYRQVPKLAIPAELMVHSLDVPDELEANVPFLVSAEVRASLPMSAKCTLTIDKVEVKVVDVTAEREPKAVDFPDVRIKDSGEHAFVVDCQPATKAAPGAEPADRIASNNRFELTRKIPEKKRFLYIDGEPLYSKNFHDAMADDFEVEVRGPKGVPSSLEDAQKFQGIAISDVPIEGAYYKQNITLSQMRVLHEYAKEGGLLIFTGGGQSLGPGGYTGTYLEKQVLPVNLEIDNELDTPRLALVLVLDRSGSMSNNRLELAKKAATETVAILDKRDTVAIVGFDSGAQKLIGLTPATNKGYFQKALRSMRADGGTNIGAGLKLALDMLDGVEAQIKHVILMTDGQSPEAGIVEMVRAAAADKITISTVAVGRESAKPLLAQIAEEGKGRFYYTEDAEGIPRLFVDETKEIAGESIKEEPSKVSLNPKFASLRFLKGIDIARAPTLDGYLPVEAKPGTETILKLTGGAPLLVRWQRGKGWVYVFTSDIKNKWARRWLAWADFAPFWRQLVKDAMPEEEKQTIYAMSLDVARGKLRISADAVDDKDQFVTDLASTATVLTPSGKTVPVTLEPVAPGRYEAVLPTTEYGPYEVTAVHTRDGKKTATSSARIAYPYPEEHLRFEPDLARIAQLSSTTGGRANPDVTTLFDTYGQSTTHNTPAWHFPLYFVVVAIALDVFLRRVRLWKAKTLTWSN
jgi:Ca-activated chloride channel family protein